MEILMINQIFNEIIEEARNKKVILMEDTFERPIHIGFNVVDEKISEDLPNFYIKNQF